MRSFGDFEAIDLRKRPGINQQKLTGLSENFAEFVFESCLTHEPRLAYSQLTAKTTAYYLSVESFKARLALTGKLPSCFDGSADH